MKTNYSEKGSALIEMALLTACVALVVFASAKIFGDSAHASFRSARNKIDGLNSTQSDSKYEAGPYNPALDTQDPPASKTPFTPVEEVIMDRIHKTQGNPAAFRELCLQMRSNKQSIITFVKLAQKDADAMLFVKACVVMPVGIPALRR